MQTKGSSVSVISRAAEPLLERGPLQPDERMILRQARSRSGRRRRALVRHAVVDLQLEDGAAQRLAVRVEPERDGDAAVERPLADELQRIERGQGEAAQVAADDAAMWRLSASTVTRASSSG